MKMLKLNNRGFSLVELLAVMAILAILMVISIPMVSRVTNKSKKQAYIDEVIIQKNSAKSFITSNKYNVYDKETVYYFDYKLIADDNKVGRSPYGDWVDCYVVVTYDGKQNHYYWTGLDKSGWKIDLRKQVKDMKEYDVYRSTSKVLKPGATIGGRDNIVIYKSGEDTPIEQTPSNDLSSDEAKKCFSFKELSDGTYSITDYDKTCGTEVDVPSSIDGKIVTIIDENAFRNKELTKVTLYYGITTLKNGAFQNNSITELKLSSTISVLGDYSFYKNKLKNVDLPEGVTYIGTFCFADNQIEYVNFPKTLATLASYSFYNNKLTEVSLKSNPSVGGAAFSRNNMPVSSALIYKYNTTTQKTDYTTIIGYGGESGTNLIIPAEVNGIAPTTIASNAFNSAGLKSVVIPDSITSIGSSAFYANSLTTLVLPKNLKTIGGQAFRQNYLKSVEIPNSVTSIGTGAFVYNCFPTGTDIIYAKSASGYDYSTIVSGASGRYDGACSGSSRTLKIPATKNGVTLKTIKNSAFTCSYYTSIELPDLSQTPNLVIETNAFYHSSLPKSKGFMYAIKNGKYDYSILDSYIGDRSGTLEIPEEVNGVKLKTINASITWTSFTSITIPSSVTTIRNGAIFEKTNRNNVNLVKIVNKTGKAFDWYTLTGSTHTNPGPFVTGTVSHQSGNIQITSS